MTVGERTVTFNTPEPVDRGMEQTTLEVTGMSCDGCERNVTDALEALEGVSSATANHEADQVRVEHDASVVDVAALSGTIEDAGYEVAA